jgi:hypothetical protein
MVSGVLRDELIEDLEVTARWRQIPVDGLRRMPRRAVDHFGSGRVVAPTSRAGPGCSEGVSPPALRRAVPLQPCTATSAASQRWGRYQPRPNSKDSGFWQKHRRRCHPFGQRLPQIHVAIDVHERLGLSGVSVELAERPPRRVAAPQSLEGRLDRVNGSSSTPTSRALPRSSVISTVSAWWRSASSTESTQDSR